MLKTTKTHQTFEVATVDTTGIEDWGGRAAVVPKNSEKILVGLNKSPRACH